MTKLIIENRGPGPTSVVIEESPQEKEYRRFVNALIKTSGVIVQNNFVSGQDDIDTPEDVTHQLVLFKALTHEMYKQQGKQDMFSIIARAKKEFLETPMIQKLDDLHRTRLVDVLRWHLRDAIHNPPPIVHRNEQL